MGDMLVYNRLIKIQGKIRELQKDPSLVIGKEKEIARLEDLVKQLEAIYHISQNDIDNK